ncbi:uncharacterized protein LOC143294950 [Babylonia areolata]|uniref:uncharacterized protein LOC143294950 n=1 Tax=Babylonia areolata TaxID=304850 RepID=UPI003FD33618
MRDDISDLGRPRYLDVLSSDLEDGVFKGHHKVARNAAHFDTVKTAFLQAMIDNLETRFPDTEKMAQFSIFGMKPLQFVADRDLETWGNEDMQKIADFYCNSQQHKGPDGTVYVSQPYLKCETADVLKEWMRCKTIVKHNRYPTHTLSSLWGALASLQQDGSLDCPHLMKLAALVLTHPVHSCDCERTFSTQNLTLTSLRNRLSSEKCD